MDRYNLWFNQDADKAKDVNVGGIGDCSGNGPDEPAVDGIQQDSKQGIMIDQLIQ